MRVICINAPNQRAKSISARALEMSAWCKEQGLTHAKDYDYAIFHSHQQIHFRFFNEHESLGSLFAMKWSCQSE